MNKLFKWLNLQLFAEGGEGGAGEGTAAAESGENAPAAEETRLRELGVPESVLAKRAKRAGRTLSAPQPVAQQAPQDVQPTQQDANAEPNAPDEGRKASRLSWDQIKEDPEYKAEYDKEMQSTIQARLRKSKAAEETMSKLAPAIELLARKYNLDAKNLDADALNKAISDDDSYYESKALELGVPIETAKVIDQGERDGQRRREEEARTLEQQMIEQHLAKLHQQGEALKTTFPQFDLATELRNPAFARMTSPNVGISVEDAYYAVHRKEIHTAAMQATAQRTAQQMANSIRSGQARPTENGTQAQAPSNTSFDYAHASKEQRDALKRQIREAAAKGQKLYPGQFNNR